MSGDVELAALADNAVAFDGGGLGRRISVYRLPEQDWSRRVAVDHAVTFPGGADLPVYLRVTQSDGTPGLVEPDLPDRLSRGVCGDRPCLDGSYLPPFGTPPSDPPKVEPLGIRLHMQSGAVYICVRKNQVFWKRQRTQHAVGQRRWRHRKQEHG